MKQSKFEKVGNIKAEVRDFDGGLIKKLKKDDINEESSFAGFVLYAEQTAKYFNLSTTTFPYTLEYSYEVKYKSLFFWPEWSPQAKIPVERSVYALIVPKDFAFKMYKRNLEIEPIEKKVKGKRQLIFELSEVPPFEPEKGMPPEIDYRMFILFAPEEFDLGGYRGSTDSWKAFGQWYASLAREQYTLSPQRQGLIKEVVKDYIFPKARVKALYQFLQRRTRYVAIHLGVGGYKPHDAESVLAGGYGDCKDLSTLFITMLSVTGIRAYPSLIRTRDEGMVLTDFPSSQFNHIITYVPLEEDTLWLDCTCNYCPFGELPGQDEGCEALVVMEDTAALIETPVSSAEENRFSSSIHARLEPDGSLSITGTFSATGNYESFYREILNSLTASEKKEWLARLIGRHAPNHTLLSCDFEKVSDLDVPFSIGFDAKLIKYSTSAGNDLLINPNLLTRINAEDILKEEQRKYPVDDNFASIEEDELTLDIPEGMVIKVVPDDEEIVFPFGSFQTRYTVNNNRLTYNRSRSATQRFIEPKDFENYKAFLSKIYTSDHSFVVLKKAE